MSTESVMPSNHLILCCPHLLLPSIFPSIRVFSNESFPPIRWPKYWSFSFNISPSNEYSRLVSFKMGFPCGSDGKESACNAGDLGSIPGLGRSPGEGKGYPPQFWPGEFHGLNCPWGLKESDTTEQLSLSLSFFSFRIDLLDLLAVQAILKSLLQCRSSKASVL